MGKCTVHIDGGNGNITLGGETSEGDVSLLNPKGKCTVHIDGGGGNITLGGHTSEGDITLLNARGKSTIHVDGGDGNISLGGAGTDGDVVVKNKRGKATIQLDGQTGTIKTNGKALTPADFVFDNNYALPQLDSVQQFITKNKHLPGVPSGKEMLKNGLDLASFSMNLLQKVEELTLYVIQQNEQLQQQATRIAELEKNSL